MRISSLFNEFFHSEKSSGIVLIICSIIAILWINDGLMTIFSLLIGLEIEREMYAGGMLVIFNRTGVNNLWLYLIPGAFMWYFMLHSGIHATITGVLLAFAIPFRDGLISSPSYRLQQFLHKPVAFFILPLFALANAGVLIGPELWAGLVSQNGLGIILGLCLGKPLGIAAASWIVLKLKWSSRPAHVTWRHLIGAGCLGGIGFTMSIFVTLLAFADPHVIEISKGAILLSSILSGLLGFAVLTFRAGTDEAAA